MLSLNQENNSDTFFNTFNECFNNQLWHSDQPHFNNLEYVGVPYQVSNTHQSHNQVNEGFIQPQSHESFSKKRDVGPNLNYAQNNPVLLPPDSWCQYQHPVSIKNKQLQNSIILAKKHKAGISLVPNAYGGFKTIIKRKRKRTMFTTEQVEVLESVFRKKPYVTREDRQLLVEQLQLTDTSVKVWFQNRRLRGKREEIEAVEESLYESPIELNMQLQSLRRPNHTYVAQIDYIESKLQQKVDRSGYLPLDEKSIKMIVDLIDSALAPNIDLETLSNYLETVTDSSSCVTDSSDCSTSILEAVTDSSDNSCNISETEVYLTSNEAEVEPLSNSSESCAHENVSMYEPISPAEPDKPYDDTVISWISTSKQLQTLFDLHFC